MHRKSISVVIPNYNGRQLLEENLPSVFSALVFANIDYEIIIVDDASSDDSTTFLKKNYPGVTVLINEVNKGFSPTINKGIYRATKELVFALNNDVKLTENYFESLFNYFEHEETFGVMGRIVDPISNKTQDAAKYPIVKLFKGIKATKNYFVEGNQAEYTPSFFLSGANALMNREKLLRLQAFDEIYAPFYYEDSDLGIRAWRVGWKCYFDANAICYHHLSSTIGKMKRKNVEVIVERNKVAFNKIHLDGIYLITFNCWLGMRCVWKLITGNDVIYKAIRSSDQNKIKHARERLKELQTETGKEFSIIEVRDSILTTIRKFISKKL